MAPIKTAPALQQAILSTYIYDIIIAVAFVLILVLVANLVKWNGGKNDSSGHTRRVWYFVLCAVTILISVGFDWLFFMRSIKVPAFVGKYVMHMAVASVISGIFYALVSFIIVKVCPVGSKLESIFPKKEK